MPTACTTPFSSISMISSAVCWVSTCSELWGMVKSSTLLDRDGNQTRTNDNRTLPCRRYRRDTLIFCRCISFARLTIGDHHSLRLDDIKRLLAKAAFSTVMTGQQYRRRGERPQIDCVPALLFSVAA